MISLFSFFRPKKPTRIFHSDINGEITIGTTYRQKTLFALGIPQSGGEYVAMWKRSIRAIEQLSNRAIEQCLVLGVGGGTVIRLLREQFPEIRITGVDIDPLMIHIAQSEFGLQSNDLNHWTVADAVSFVKQKKHRGKFDLIIVDLYIGALNPPETRTKSFLLNLKHFLKKQGVVLYNSHYQTDNPEEFEQFQTLCSSLFSKFDIVFQYPRNRILHLHDSSLKTQAFLSPKSSSISQDLLLYSR